MCIFFQLFSPEGEIFRSKVHFTGSCYQKWLGTKERIYIHKIENILPLQLPFLFKAIQNKGILKLLYLKAQIKF